MGYIFLLMLGVATAMLAAPFLARLDLTSGSATIVSVGLVVTLAIAGLTAFIVSMVRWHPTEGPPGHAV